MSRPLMLDRIAAELDRMQGEIEELGEALCGDPALVSAHWLRLQSLDELAQRHRHLATLLRAADLDAAARRVSLEALRHRLVAEGVPCRSGRGRVVFFALQILVVCAVLWLAVCAPPRQGSMLILPMVATPIAETINWSLAHDASLVGPGPVSGSIIIVGKRANVIGAALQHRSLVLSAPVFLCGAPAVV